MFSIQIFEQVGCQVFDLNWFMDIVHVNNFHFGTISFGTFRVFVYLQVPKIAVELSDLVVYCQAVHFGGWQHAKDKRN